MTKGIYIYGIVPNFYSTTQFQLLENSGVYAVSFENISAIVSDRNGTSLDYDDRESLGHLLIHHQKTIESLRNKGFTMLIPMRLGTIVSSKGEVIKILARGYDLIIDTLKKIEHLTEIDLVVTWLDFSGILKEVSSHPEIAALKEEILKKNGEPSQLDRVKIGMLVQGKLEEKNKSVELKVLDVLSSYGLDIKIHEVMNDEMVSNSAFLIHSNNQKKFELAIERLDEEYNNILKFKLIGPLPCYSFYTLEVKSLSPEQVEQAGIVLGLNEQTSESGIKKAYLENARLFHPDTHPGNGDQDNFNRINKAYHTLLDYTAAVKQSSKQEIISLTKEKMNENLILVKIKE